MRVFLPLEASGASCNGQNSANPWVKPCFLRCCVFQTAINICAKISPKCSTKASQKRQKSKQKLLGQASKKHLFFQSVLLSKCARKGPPTRTHYLLILHSLLSIFSELVGLCRPDSQKRHSLWHLPPKIMKITVWFTLCYVCFCIISVCKRAHARAFLCNYLRLLYATASLAADTSGKAHAWCANVGGAAMPRRRRLR